MASARPPASYIVFSLLRPAVRLAKHFGVSLKQVQDWTRLAYFDELRNDGQTIPETSKSLGISEGTGHRLAKQLRENFLTTDSEYSLGKRVVFTLWTGPQSVAKLAQVLGADTKTIKGTLTRLEKEGQVIKVEGRTTKYKIKTRADRLVDNQDWVARASGLDTIASTFASTVKGRFIDEADSSFARTVSFRWKPSDQEKLRNFYQEKVWPFILEMDEQAAEDPAASPARIAMFWSPVEEQPQPKELS